MSNKKLYSAMGKIDDNIIKKAIESIAVDEKKKQIVRYFRSCRMCCHSMRIRFAGSCAAQQAKSFITSVYAYEYIMSKPVWEKICLQKILNSSF